MAVLEARGFSFTRRPKRKVDYRFGFMDSAIVACGLLAFGIALSVRLDLLRFIA
jgi:hypothetical protein